MIKTVIPNSELDLEQRTIITVGYAPGELLPPYNNGIIQEDAEKILRYIEGKDVIKRKTALFLREIKQKFQQIPAVVEIVGCVTEACVCTTADAFILLNSFVLINPELVATFKPDNSFEFNKNYLINDLLTPAYQKRECVNHEHGLLFYRTK